LKVKNILTYVKKNLVSNNYFNYHRAKKQSLNNFTFDAKKKKKKKRRT